ncbi:hypothetical protein GDO78_002619 [Eleutherodactylus coqui]|uniref:Histone acetyltransferase type B catalytic subunit n=1 Tax=Eleutherodactylus coqui TaxID=57060 RepID=A0A8J6K1B9_ELECQ|nr:hypothetical protein GDO78_002619 [Eleutherodactylus coqui]
MEKKLAEYKCNTNEVIKLKLVRFPEDIDDEGTLFNPEFSHQIFGDDEVAFGYKGLQILLYYTAGNLSTMFRVHYTSKVDEKFEEVQADDVESKIREIIPPGFCCGTDDFVSLLEKEADLTCPGFRDYHERLQTFLMWFIETASYIDVDDERWDYFLVFEKYNKDGTTLFATVGYMTVYNYYVYPDKTRPPEDPSENFVRLRDFVLAKLCQNLPCFSPEKLLEGFSKEMVTEAQQKLKINKQHARRVYEILRFRATDMADPEKSRSYRLEVKKRLVGPYKKNQREMAKMRRCLKPEELTNQMNQIDLKTQHEQLEQSYQELVSEYRRTVERLAQA